MAISHVETYLTLRIASGLNEACCGYLYGRSRHFVCIGDDNNQPTLFLITHSSKLTIETRST